MLRFKWLLNDAGTLSRITIVLLGASLYQTASAQTSVTLYGLLDDGITYTNNVNGHTSWRADQGFAQSGRWGLKGAEDLGNGLSAIFQLENGFDVNSGRTGQGGREFRRQARVGLRSIQFGTLTMGRQYDSMVDFVGPLTSNGGWAGAPFSHPFDNDNTDNSFRVNNSIKYTSPTYAGLIAGGMYAMSNNAGFSDNRTWSVGAGYKQGPLLVGVAYLKADHPGLNANGAISTTDAMITAQGQQTWGGGVNYTIGKAILALSYTNSTFYNPGANNLSGVPYSAAKMAFQNVEFDARYAFTPALLAGVAYTYTSGKQQQADGTQHTHWHQAGLMADYALSQRTDVYAMAVWQRVGGTQIASGGMENALILGAAGSSDDRSQLLIHAGLRVKF
jgi:predicted porin